MAIKMNGAYFSGMDIGRLDVIKANIPGSVTTDYILFSLNVAKATNPDINFGLLGPVLATGGRITADAANLLVDIVKRGVSQGRCQRVWLSIGGAGLDAFNNIAAILAAGGTPATTLMANFSALVSAVRVAGVQSVGFDMDFEEGGDLATLVSKVTMALYNQFKPNCPVTFCPFDDEPSWLKALQLVYGTLKTQPVVAYNLQTYASGGGNKPRDWTATIAKAPNTGITDPTAFVWPIVSCDPTATPNYRPELVPNKLREWQSKGASLWTVANLTLPPAPPMTLTGYSKAIAEVVG